MARLTEENKMIIRLLETLICAAILIPTMLLFGEVVEGRAFPNRDKYSRPMYILACGIEIICLLIFYGSILFIIYHVALAMANK